MGNKISIITVVFNGSSTIEHTILSVVNQSYSNIEYLIIDGNSNDDTIEIIMRYNQFVTLWISEPDKGIYDAMNKGIVAASGDYILFLNSGDLFYSIDTLTKIFSQYQDSDVIYGDTLVNKKTIKALDLKSDWKAIPYCHQSVFIKSTLAKRYFFDLQFKVAADYNQYFELKRNKCSFIHVNEIISIYDNSGFSNQNYTRLLTEYMIISVKNQNSMLLKIYVWTYFVLRRFKHVTKK